MKFAVNLIEFTLTTEDKEEFDTWLNTLKSLLTETTYLVGVRAITEYINNEYKLKFEVNNLDKLFYIINKLDVTIYDT